MLSHRLVMVFVAIMAAGACRPEHAVFSEADRTVVAAEVDSATRAFEAAERDRDAERLIAQLAPDFTMLLDGSRVGYDSIATSIRTTLPGMMHFEPGFDDIEVLVLGPDAAMVSFVFNDSIVTPDDQLLMSRGPTTLVWQRLGSDWLVVFADADHYPVE